MRYFIMKPLGKILLPQTEEREGTEVIITSDISRFGEIDYDERSGLISDRFKSLIELYTLKSDFEPVVYLDAEKQEQAVFWRFAPPVYENYKAIYKNNGVPSHISFHEPEDAPILFTAKSPRGVRSVIISMAVAESALRRGILGVKFTKTEELIEDIAW